MYPSGSLPLKAGTPFQSPHKSVCLALPCWYRVGWPRTMWEGQKLPLVTGHVPKACQRLGSKCLWRLIGSLSLSLPVSVSCLTSFPGGLSLWSDAVSSSVPAMSMQPRSLIPRNCRPEVGHSRGVCVGCGGCRLCLLGLW